MDGKQDILNRITSLRKEMGLSQTELGEKMGKSRSMIAQIEGGHTELRAEYIISLSKITKRSYKYIIDGVEENSDNVQISNGGANAGAASNALGSVILEIKEAIEELESNLNKEKATPKMKAELVKIKVLVDDLSKKHINQTDKFIELYQKYLQSVEFLEKEKNRVF